MVSHSHAALPARRGEPALHSHGQVAQGRFVLQFQSLFPRGRNFEFPCDCSGQVDLDAMGERIRNNYLFARAMVGRELAWPSVQSRPDHPGGCTGSPVPGP